MYGKLFAQMYDGTLGTSGPWQALVTFQQLVILADEDGVVDCTPEAIARRTTIPLEIINIGLVALEQPDPGSRTPDEEGRRIVRLSHERSWGWRVVNYLHYRKIRTAEDRREYHRTYARIRRAKVNSSAVGVNNVNNVNPNQPIAEAEVKAEALKASTPNGVEVLVAEDKCPVQQIIDLYHESLTGLPRLKVLTAARRQTIRQRFREDLPSLVHWSRFFSHVAQSDFLMGRTEPRPGQRRFVADLEWLTKAGNFAKIAEGKYHAA